MTREEEAMACLQRLVKHCVVQTQYSRILDLFICDCIDADAQVFHFEAQTLSEVIIKAARHLNR